MYRILHIRLLCVIGASLFSFVGLSAQTTDTVACKQLLEVEVVSEAVPSQSLSSVPLQVMDQADFRRRGTVTLDEAVKRMCGVDIHDYGGVGGLKTVSVRGLGAKHTAVSFDGVVISGANSGQVDIGRLSLENVSMLSLSMAGVDDIFRSASEFASASLLSLETLRPVATASYVRLRTGSFGLADVSLHHDHCFRGGWSAAFHGSYQRSDGMYPFKLVNIDRVAHERRKNSDVDYWAFEGTLFGKLWGGDFRLKAVSYNSERGLPGSVNLYNKEVRERLWNDDFSLQMSYAKPFGDKFAFKLRAKYDYHYSEYLEINKNYSLGRQLDKNTENGCYVSAGVKLMPWNGLSFAFTSDLTYSVLRSNFENASLPRRVNSVSVLAAKYETARFSATASLLGSYVADYVSAGSASAPFRRLSPSLALTYRPFASFPLLLRASYKDCYRVPTFADLYYLRLGNVGLKPEKATQFNLGLTWSASFGRVVEFLLLTVDGYCNTVRDKIVALPTMYVWRMMNFGKATISGADVGARLQLAVARRLSVMFDAGYSFQYAVDVTDPSAKNYLHQLPYTPRHTGKFTFSFLSPILNVSYMFTAVGDRYMLPQNTPRNKMDGYVEHSLSANREFTFGRFRLHLGGEFLNVGDKQYEIIRYYPMPGFSWRLSAKFSF